MKTRLILLSLILVGILKGQSLLNNLRACYPLNCDGAVNQATTGNSYDGTINANLTCANGRTGLSNTAYQFSGTGSKILINNPGLINSPTAVSVSGWYYVSSVGTLVYCIGPCNLVSRPTYELRAVPWNSSFVFQLSIGGCNLIPTYINSNTIAGLTPGLSFNTWYHVVFYLNSTTATLWVNTLSGSASHNDPMAYSSGKPIVLGATNESPDNPFAGRIDNVRFYDRLLTQPEIVDLYTNDPSCPVLPSPPPPPPTPGNYCSGSLNGLTADYQIGLNGFTYNFTTPSNTGGKVIIGRTTCASATARLMVGDDNIGNSIFGNSSTSGDNIGVKGAGVDMNVNPAATTFGVLGEAHQSNNPTALSAGVAGFCGGWNSNMMPHGQNIGVYGNSISNTGAWAGYFDGDVNINGNGWILAPWTFSDQRFKKDINKLENVNEKLKKLNGYSYNFRKGEFANKNFDEQKHIGFIAQEIKEVFPELVKEGKDGFYGVDYQGMIPILLEAFKNQQQQIDELKSLVQSLAGVPAGNKNGTSTTAVELSNKNAIVLDQNVPNPFAESTMINYFIPSDVKKAQILFSTNEGKLIKVVDLIEKGAGSLNVFANDLTHGIYTYTLVVDGKTIGSKKMIKE